MDTRNEKINYKIRRYGRNSTVPLRSSSVEISL